MTPPPRSLARRLRFAQLELVLEVAAHGNLAEAARRLHLTRAGASKSIKELEASLGQPLFARSRQGMQLTAAGARVAQHAHLLVHELRHLTEAARSSESEGGVLRIGLQPFVAEYVLPGVLQRLHAAAPGAASAVHLREGRIHSLIELLLGGEVDAVMALYAPRAVDALDLSRLRIRPFAAVPMVVVASPRLAVPARRLKWPDLAGRPWVLPPANTHQRTALDQMFSARGSAPPTPAIESPSFAANVELAAAGLGLAVVPMRSAETALASGRVRKVDVGPDLPPTSVALIYREVSAIYLEPLKALERAIEA